MVDITKQPLIILSIAGLWDSYMSDSSSICMFNIF